MCAATAEKLTPGTNLAMMVERTKGCAFRGVFAGWAMSEGGSHRAARTIGLALVAGLVAFEVVLAVTAGAIGIPGVLIVPLHEINGGDTASGGESVIAKQMPKSIASATSQPGQASAQAGPVEQIASTQTLPPPVVVDEPTVTPDVFALAVPIDATVNLPVAAVAHARAVMPSQSPPVASTPQASAATAAQEDGKPASPPAGVSGDLNLGSIRSDAAESAAAEIEKKPRQTLRDSTPTEDLPWGDTVPVPLSQLVPQAGAKPAAPTASAPSPQQ